MLFELTSSTLVSLFAISGAIKVLSLGSNDSKRLADRLKIKPLLAQHLVLLVGVLELVGVYFILRGIWSNPKSVQSVHLGVWILSILTVIATFVFFVRPKSLFSHNQFRAEISNVTTISALILLPMVCHFKEGSSA